MYANSVLIIDDDEMFRSLVKDILERRGLNVIEASSGQEAFALLAKENPILALVDYRLPEMDGITWITQLRQRGKNIPVVLISGAWCDAATFNRLRGLLKVSLVLQKPINPDLFMQQVESLLPTSVVLRSQTTAAPLKAPPKPAAAAVHPIDPLKALRTQADRSQRIAEVRALYAKDLGNKWEDLGKAVRLARENNLDRIDINEAITLAHKMRGTAGSVGFTRSGDSAGKIEDLLNSLDASDTMQEVIWTEIFRCLADGESALRAETQSARKKTEGVQTFASKKVLMLGNEAKYKPITHDLLTEHCAELHADVAESLSGFLQKAHRGVYQAAIVDLSTAAPSQIYSAIRDVRSLPNHHALPICCIVPPTVRLSDVDRTYAGFSVVLNGDINKEVLTRACEDLLIVKDARAPRVLTVDDDQVLTQFIRTILTAEEMAVGTLNAPIAIMDAMEQFKPDLVLLDVLMPGLSGYDVARKLRAHERWKDVGIVFITSKSDHAGRASAFHSGGNDFLSKPILAEELLVRVRAQVEAARRRRGLTGKDILTGALNGPDFVREANALLDAAREREVQATLCLLGLDEFAHIGIVHGMYGARDAAATLGRLIHQRFRSEDLRGKIGEDCFAIAFIDMDDATVGESIKQLLAEYGDIKIPCDSMSSFKATFSAGVAQYPRDGSTVQQLLSCANQRLLTGRQRELGAISYVGAPR